ncbi:MAG TPA: sulfatase-like hydrolase/transferase [Candidatus Acidoferrum sp.]|nr:sulfatase-like hydrolase/transferase [Candidatus Acidoferrum sp.]
MSYRPVLNSTFSMKVLRQLAWIILLAGSVGAATSSPPKATQAPRPSIILITVDTTRADRVGFLGSPRGLTPNLDAVAKQGVVFTRAYSHVPLTTASHATILTGTYPQFNHVNDFGAPLAKDLPYLPSVLHEHGYKTAAFVGSVILDPVRGAAPGFDRGFDTYDAGFTPRLPGTDRYKTVERRGGEVVEHALAWLSKQHGVPFFLWVHLYDPHAPYEAPEPFKTRYAAEPYDGEIAYADSVLGKLLNQLRAGGLYDGALIAMMADHGEAFGEHGEREHGIFLYDETLHVPLMYKMPRGRFAGKRIEARARLVDVAPTILEIAGLAPPRLMQGESLMSMVKPHGSGAVATRPQMVPDRPAYAETDYPERAFGWSPVRSLRTGRYLLIEAPRKELYDQSVDLPAEHDLSSTASAVMDTLTSRLDEFRQKTASSTEALKPRVDPELVEKLAALGYVASSGNKTGTGTGPAVDPKDKIESANVLRAALLQVEDARYAEAIPVLQEVQTKEPGIPITYLALGNAYSWLKDYEKALPQLRVAVELFPHSMMTHYQLGLALFHAEDFQAAALQFEAAVARSPRWADLHFSLASVYARLDRETDAVKELEIAVRLKPDDFRANLILGSMLTKEGKPEAALPRLEKAVQLQPRSADAHLFLAEAYSKLGQEEKASRERTEADRLGAADKP